MASQGRRQAHSLIAQLVVEPYRFDTRQAARVLDAWRLAAKLPPVRFRSSLSLSFPVSDIESVALPLGGAEAPVVTVSYLGLGGATGPLPTPYTEYLSAGVRRGEPAGRDFLDLFNHRLVGSSMDLARLFRPALQGARPQDGDHAARLYALLGLAMPSHLRRDPHFAASLLPLAGLLNQEPLSAHAIERAVSAQFGVPARVTPFRGGWMQVPHGQCTVLGRGGRHQRLGRTAMLGGRVWDQAAGITLAIGPVALDRAERFLPLAADHPRLAKLLRFLAADTVGVEVRLRVRRPTLRASRLGRSPMRLGWTSWLSRGKATPGVTEIVLGPRVAVPVGLTKR